MSQNPINSYNFGISQVTWIILTKTTIFQKLFIAKSGLQSIKDIRRKIKPKGLKIQLLNGRFACALSSALLEHNFRLRYFWDSDGDYFLVYDLKSEKIPKIAKYEPLLFVEFGNENDRLVTNGMINSVHPLGKGLLENQEIFIDQFEMYFLGLVDAVVKRDFNRANLAIDYFLKVLKKPVIDGLEKIDMSAS